MAKRGPKGPHKFRELRAEAADVRGMSPEEYRLHRERISMKHYCLHFLGLSPDEYERILERHSGLCDICGQPPGPKAKSSKSGSRFHIDHCHATNRFRGFLCPSCNVGLGQFQDNPDLLERAAAYLKRST